MSTVTHWKNAYGSTMDLWQGDDGSIVGQYKSDTGSTGVYLVVGWAAGPAPSAQAGQPMALALSWRSVTGGTGDPSWHWVSGLGGQHLPAAGETPESLVLNHALVATTAFPGLAGPGTYIDKLVYLPTTADSAAAKAPAVGAACAGTDPVDGTWRCREQPELAMTLSVVDADLGVVQGTLAQGGTNQPLYGVTDTRASADSLALQALSVTAPLPASTQTLALAGSLDLASGVITLTDFTSQGTTAGNAYLQTTVSSLTFVRA